MLERTSDIIYFHNKKINKFSLWGGLGVDGRTILEWTLKR